MTAILAIETSTEACSAALFYKGQIESCFELAPQKHASLILKQCDTLLKRHNLVPAQLSAVAFGRGPGSFTGVRIATAVTQGIAIAHDLPVIPVSTLQCLAQTAYDKFGEKLGIKKIKAGIDARMGEIYTGEFEYDESLGMMKSLSPENLTATITDSNNNITDNNWFYAGSGFQKTDCIYPSAASLLILAIHEFKNKNNVLSADLALPVYLRDNVVF